MENTIYEIIVFLIIAFRIYILYKFNVKSAADKLFALYYLKNHYPLIGYIVIFYLLEIIAIELSLNIVDIVLIILFSLEVFLVYRHLFIPLKTDNKDDYIDTVIKRIFTTLTFTEYQQIKEEFYKPQPIWKLYLTEMLVFFLVIYHLEIGV